MLNFIKKFFPKKKEKIEDKKEKDNLSKILEFYKNRDKDDNSFSENILQIANSWLADQPKKFVNSAMDSVSIDSTKQAFTLGDTRINDNLLSWYISQTFIGFQACALISQHWLVLKACYTKGEDAVRTGYDIIIDSDDEVKPSLIKKIERIDRRYHVKKNLIEADAMKNIFGIRHILFLVDSSDPEYYEKPFNPDGITPGSYKGMSQIDPYWVVPELTGDTVERPESKNFYDPEFWIVSGKRIHKSHFVILRGPELPDILKPAYQYAGVPLTQRIYERVYSAERTANEGPELTMTKRLNALQMDLEKAVTNPSQFMKNLKQIINFRNNYGIYAIGKEENLTQLDTNLTDLDSVIMTQYQLVAAIAEMPATRLIQTSPKGFQSTGEHEIKTYNQKLSSIRGNELSSVLDRHHLCVERSFIKTAIGNIEIYHEWCPLYELSPSEQADINQKESATAVNYGNLGAVDAYDVRSKLRNDQGSGYSHIEEVERPEGIEPDLDPLNVDVEEVKNEIVN